MIGFASLSATTSECKGPDWELFVHCCLAPSLLIVLLLSFAGKRYNYRLKSLFGIKYLAVVYPINLLDDHEHRWSHALAFGATASMVTILFSGDYASLYLANPDDSPTWVKVLLGVVATIELGTILFPFFACITSPSKFVASLLGLMYATVWFSVLLSHIILCPDPDREGFTYESVILQLPVLVFTFLLVIRFLYYLIKSVRKRVRGKKLTAEEKLKKSHKGQHVMALLKPPAPERVYYKRWERIIYHFYKPSVSFMYPTRIICTFVVAVLCQYQLAITVSYGFDKFLDKAFANISNFYEIYAEGSSVSDTVANQTRVAIGRYEIAAHVSWYLACPIAIIISLGYIVHIFICFRKHMLRLYQGDRRFLPDFQQPPEKSMTGSLQYCGFQIAYYLSGYVIMTFMTFVVIYVLSGALVIPFINIGFQYFLDFINIVLPLFVVIFLVFGSQPILAKRVFLQPKLDQNDKEKPLALQHRDFYHIFSYFLVFLNVIVGLMACVVRICIGLVVGVFLLCRIDRPILMRGYENLDQSYQAYIGNLIMINAHSHPVLVVFCQLLVNSTMVRKRARLGRSKGSLEEAASYAFVEHDTASGKARTNSYKVVGYGSTQNSTSTLGKSITPRARAVLRWQLAYTLLFNPNLLSTRKRSRQITYQELDKHILKVATLLPHRQQVLQRTKAAEAAGGGRVMSEPVFYPDADDRLAAELLSRELMADKSDYEEGEENGEDKDIGEDSKVDKGGALKEKDVVVSNEPTTLRSFAVLRSEGEESGNDVKAIELRGSQNVEPVRLNTERIPIQAGAAIRQPDHQQQSSDVHDSKPKSSEIAADSPPTNVHHDNIVIHLDAPQHSSTDDDSVVDQ